MGQPGQTGGTEQPSGKIDSVGFRINNNGLILGRAGSQSVAWNANGGVCATLGTVPGYEVVWPKDMNDSGQVVDYIAAEDFDTLAGRPVFWDARGKVHMLPTIDEDYGHAYSINSNGEIVGDGYDQNGECKILVWTPR